MAKKRANKLTRWIISLGACGVPGPVRRARSIQAAWKAADGDHQYWVMKKFGFQCSGKEPGCPYCNEESKYRKTIWPNALRAYRKFSG